MKTFAKPMNSKSFSGRLFGTTKNSANPDAPVKRRVHLLVADSAMLISIPRFDMGEIVVSSDSGEWEFQGLNPLRKYHVIAYDHTGQYDPVVKMNLVPTVD